MTYSIHEILEYIEIPTDDPAGPSALQEIAAEAALQARETVKVLADILTAAGASLPAETISAAARAIREQTDQAAMFTELQQLADICMPDAAVTS